MCNGVYKYENGVLSRHTLKICRPLHTTGFIPRRTLQHHTVLSNAIQYHTALFRVLPYLTFPYRMMQHGTMQVIADADEHGAAVLGVLMKATVKVSRLVVARDTVTKESYL